MIARGQLLQAAGNLLGELPSNLGILDGVVKAPNGRALTLGSLSRHASVSKTTKVRAQLKPQSALKLVGTSQPRIDALEIVTGRKQFAMDIDVPDALPTMVCRPPTINGTAQAVRNLAQVRAMPGITDVAIIPQTANAPGGVAVRARTFGQCIDAIDALQVDWDAGSANGKSEADVLADLKRAELPLTPVGLLGKSLEQVFTSNSGPAIHSRRTVRLRTCERAARRSGRH